jgi:hypothetical protein
MTIEKQNPAGAKESKDEVSQNKTVKNAFAYVPVSKKTEEGMSWNINDRKYLLQCFNIMDLEYDKKIDKVFEDIGKTFIQRDAYFLRKDVEINKKFDSIMAGIEKSNKKMTSINRKLANIQKVQADHGTRISQLENAFDTLLKEHKINH